MEVFTNMTTSQQRNYQSIFNKYPDVVTVEQLSNMLNISTKTAYILLKKNVINHFKIGRIYKIPKTHIMTYLNITNRGF